jgi:hypothetical protein
MWIQTRAVIDGYERKICLNMSRVLYVTESYEDVHSDDVVDQSVIYFDDDTNIFVMMSYEQVLQALHVENSA